MRYVMVFLIRVYQKVSRFKPRTCRFEPSCSEYAAQAILKYGPFRGMVLAIWRLLRCNPWNPGGYDPVK
ncbi:MAG: membrane protein insertion efficiency factor YidD [Armatimonadota bacterium]|nr:membrane protein insertion efficiency factor YidD [Armatimonadota bacterium]